MDYYIDKINKITKQVEKNNNLNKEQNLIMEDFKNTLILFKEYAKNNKIQEEDQRYINYFDKKDIEELDDMILEYNLMFDYLDSYLTAASILADKITKDKKYELKYSYFFNISHSIELIIKILKRYNFIEDEEDIINGSHDTYKMFSSLKLEILELGLEETEFNKILNAINEIKSFTHYQNDLSVAFKYPIKKDFKSSSIKKKFFKLPSKELIKIINSHMELIKIIYLLKSLCILKNSKAKIKSRENVINDMKNITEVLKEKYNLH